jgi:virulence-associated protein VagC
LEAIAVNTAKLFPKDKRWDMFLAGLSGFSDDFMRSGKELDEQDEQDEQKDRDSL